MSRRAAVAAHYAPPCHAAHPLAVPHTSPCHTPSPRHTPSPGAHLAPLYDLLLSHRPLASAAHLAPDVVVHVGARLVSKRLV